MPDVTAIDEDIILAEYPLHAVIGLNDVKDEYEKRHKIINTPHLLLVKIHGLAIFDPDAQKFLTGDEEAAITKAAAILCDKEAGFYEHGKLLISYFIGSRKMRFPVKLFDEENEALNWLRTKNL